MGWPHILWSCYNVGEALACREVNTQCPILFTAVYFNNIVCLSKKGSIWPLVFGVNYRQLMGTCHIHEFPEQNSILHFFNN